FSFIKSGIQHLYLKDADGSAPEEVLVDSENWVFPCDWSADGQFILYGSSRDLWAVSLAGERKTLKVATNSTGFIGDAHFAPDGRSIVYVSEKSGGPEIYLQAFPNQGLPWRVSTGGGSAPRWSRSGKEIFFISADGKLMAARLGLNLHTATPE